MLNIPKNINFSQNLKIPESYFWLKRAIDILASLILIILFLPVWLIVPIIIKLSSNGPILYKQKRVGLRGKPFTILKFRSMVVNADEIIKKNPRLWRKFQESDWKLENDPRVTKTGRMLRRLTLDELPQLFNVLKGDMSLVGPRAYRFEEIKYQKNKHSQADRLINLALAVKPGITGPWQTSGRNDVPFVERVKLDAYYALKHSIYDDIIIILKTPVAMISRW